MKIRDDIVITLGWLLLLSGVSCEGLIGSSCRGNVGDSPECRSDHVTKGEYQDGGVAGFIAESLEVYAPVSTTVENELCRKHGLLFQDGVRNNKMWALRMLDASSKLPSGVLAGSDIHLGNFDECLSVEDVESEHGRFSGQHCMVSIGEPSFANEINFFTKKSLSMDFNFVLTEDDFEVGGAEKLVSKLSMMRSVCVPSSCGPRDVEQHLRSTLRTRLGNVSISVHDGACNSRANRKPLRTSDWGVILFLSVIAVLVVLSTWYDVTTWKSSSRQELLLAFSLKYHWRRLVRVDPPSVNDLPALNGVKVTSMMGIILIHNAMFTTLNPAINFSEFVDKFLLQAGLIGTFITNGHLAVDSFFLMSGLLVCFNFLKDRENGLVFNLPRYYWHRYIRLTPLYAVEQLIVTTLYTADGVFEGPYWGYNARNIRRVCDNWWHSMLYVNNYLPPEEMCNGHSWYLSADMQLFLISPMILYPLWRWPTSGKRMLYALTFLGTAISVGVAVVNILQIDLMPDSGELNAKFYYSTQTRFTPWLIGLGLGYVLHSTKRSSPRLSSSVVTSCWLVSGALMTASLFLIGYFLSPDYQYDRLSSSLYLGLMRPAWSLGLAWTVFALSRGYGARSVTSVFSSHISQILGRLSYSVYLIHLLVMLVTLANVKTPVHLSMFTVVPKFFSDVLLSLIMAMIFHFLFEAPPIYIERMLLGNNKKHRRE